jgi:uncharacterized protein YggU (UPF0235/DUF167 family)
LSSRWTSRAGAVVFQVRLTPKGGRDAIEGWARASDGSVHMKARVRAAPEDGKANDALVALLARELGVAKSALTIVAGQKARLKTIETAGDTAVLSAKLEAWSSFE